MQAKGKLKLSWAERLRIAEAALEEIASGAAMDIGQQAEFIAEEALKEMNQRHPLMGEQKELVLL